MVKRRWGLPGSSIPEWSSIAFSVAKEKKHADVHGDMPDTASARAPPAVSRMRLSAGWLYCAAYEYGATSR